MFAIVREILTTLLLLTYELWSYDVVIDYTFILYETFNN